MLKPLKDKVRKRLVSEYGGLLSQEASQEAELKEVINHLLEDIAQHEHISVSGADKQQIISELVNDLLGFGPIEHLLKDPYVTEIMINGPKKIYVERHGKTELSNVTFDNDQQLMTMIHKILSPKNRHIDESCPYVDVSMNNDSRVNIIIPPLALNGPVVTIRKFSQEVKTIDDLIQLGTLDKRMSDFLVACIKSKVNIMFSGATGVGKTTTLNVLSSYIANNERIITIENTAELNLGQEHVVKLEARPASIEGKGEITIRELFQNSLHMRPERIILGEIIGAEALDMLQAICSGHEGSLAVIHANSPYDVIYRLETMILTSGLPITIDAIHRQIVKNLNLIVQQEQLSDGSRKITHLTQVSSLKDGEVILEDIFIYDLEGIDSQGKVQGRWKATGVIPAFYQLFKKAGVNLPQEIFNKD